MKRLKRVSKKVRLQVIPSRLAGTSALAPPTAVEPGQSERMMSQASPTTPPRRAPAQSLSNIISLGAMVGDQEQPVHCKGACPPPHHTHRGCSGIWRTPPPPCSGRVRHRTSQLADFAYGAQDPTVDTSAAAVRDLRRRHQRVSDVAGRGMLVSVGHRAPPSTKQKGGVRPEAVEQVVHRLSQSHHGARDAFLAFDNDRGESGVPVPVLRRAMLRGLGSHGDTEESKAAVDHILSKAATGQDGLVDYAAYAEALEGVAAGGGATSLEVGEARPPPAALPTPPKEGDIDAADPVAVEGARAEAAAQAAMESERPAAGLARAPVPFGEPAEDWGDHTLPSSKGHEALLRAHMRSQKYRGLRKSVEARVPAHVSWGDIQASAPPSAPGTPPPPGHEGGASDASDTIPFVPGSAAPPAVPAASGRTLRRTSAAERRVGALQRRIHDRMQQLYGSSASGLRKLFFRFNRTSDGSTSTEDMAKGLRAAGVTVSDEDVRLLVGSATGAAGGSEPAPVQRGTRVKFGHFAATVSGGATSAPSIPHPYAPSGKGVPSKRGGASPPRAPPPGGDVSPSVALRDAQRKVEAAMSTQSDAARKLFLAVDRVRDGVLEHEEVVGGLRDMGVLLSKAEEAAMVQALDPTGVGAVSYSAFVNTLCRPGVVQDEVSTLPQGGDDPVDRMRKEHAQRHGGTGAPVLEDDAFEEDAAIGVDASGVLVTRADLEAAKMTPAQRYAALLGQNRRNASTVLGGGTGAPRDAHGTPAHYTLDGTGDLGASIVDRGVVEAKKANAVVRDVVARLNRKGRPRDLFLKLNFNKDGKIDVKELRLGLARIGVHLSRDQYTAFTNRIDLDANGDIDYSEFAKALTEDERVGDTSIAVVEGRGTDPFLEEMEQWYRPHRYVPPADASEAERQAVGLPRLSQDSRQVFSSLVSEGAVPATSLGEARMANDVVGRMDRKAGAAKNLYRRLAPGMGKGIPTSQLRERLLDVGLHVSQRQVDALLGGYEGDSIDYNAWVALTKPRGYFDLGSEDPAATRTALAAKKALAAGKSLRVRPAGQSLSEGVAAALGEGSPGAERLTVRLAGSGTNTPSKRRLPVGVSSGNSRLASGASSVEAEVALVDDGDLNVGLGDMGSPPPPVGIFGATGGDMSACAAAFVDKTNTDPTGTSGAFDILARHQQRQDAKRTHAADATAPSVDSSSLADALARTRGAGSGAQMHEHPGTAEEHEGCPPAGVTPARRRRGVRAGGRGARDSVASLLAPGTAATTDDLPTRRGGGVQSPLAAGLASGAGPAAAGKGRSRSAYRGRRQEEGGGAAEALGGQPRVWRMAAPPPLSHAAAAAVRRGAGQGAGGGSGAGHRPRYRDQRVSHLQGAGAVVPTAEAGVVTARPSTSQARGRHPGYARSFSGSGIFSGLGYGGSPPRVNKWGHLTRDKHF